MVKLNIGCGDRAINEEEGWLNFDLNSYRKYANVIKWDIREGVPIDNVDVILVSHILEHLPNDDIQKFIKACYNSLKKGGLLKIVVPSTETTYNHRFMFPYHFYCLHKDKIKETTASSTEYQKNLKYSTFELEKIKNKYRIFRTIERIYKWIRFFIINEQEYYLRKK